MKSNWIIGFILLIGCSSSPPVKQVSNVMLFPEGKYQQDVSVEITAESSARNFDFSCLIRHSKNEMLLVGYSHFGISLFKIHEVEGKALEADTSIDEIGKNKDLFVKIFKLVKAIMKLERHDSRIHDDTIHLNESDIASDVKFSEYDQRGVPIKILVQSEGLYSVKIKTTSYDWLKTDTVLH